jgi:hypothetical protein
MVVQRGPTPFPVMATSHKITYKIKYRNSALVHGVCRAVTLALVKSDAICASLPGSHVLESYLELVFVRPWMLPGK